MPEFNELELIYISKYTENINWWGAALPMIYGIAVGCNAKTMMEIGVWKGASSRALLYAAYRNNGHVYSVDIEFFKPNVPIELYDRWTYIYGDSLYVCKLWHKPLDLLLIDGAHDYEHVSQELEHLGKQVREGGIILLDDCWANANGEAGYPGVLQAFEEFAAAKEKFFIPYGAPDLVDGINRTLGVIRR